MTAFPSYATGTVSVNNGDTAIVGVSTIWSGVNARPGDIIIVNGLAPVEIKDVTDVTHLALWSAWAGGNQAAVSYTIVQKSPLRFAGGQAMADVSSLVAALNTDGFYVFVGPTLSVPDPSYGNDNQFAFQPSTSKLWLKTGGTWVFQGIFKGLNITGAWSSATAYNINDVVSMAGSSYVCVLANTNQTPPNATYWALLALAGAGYGGSSTTSLLIAIASKVFTTQAGLAYQVGGYVRASSAANGANYMEGFVTAYSSTTLTINVIAVGGSGTFADWNFATGSGGATGATGAGYGGSSTTSLLIAIASKVFTTQAGLAYQVGNYVRASSAANGANYMEGNITAYSSTTLTINVTRIGGSGTLADWNFATAGAPGATGAGYGGSSTTSLLIAIASKVFTTQAGLAYQVGGYVRASSAANGANYMEGFVTAYSSTTLTINVIAVGGSGTFADWNFATGSGGATGATGAGYGGSSTTSLLIAIASKVFTTQAGLAYQVGNYVRASSAANGANYMEGNITAYSSTTLTINVTRIGGSGTLADWNFATAGAPGSGDLLSTNNLSDVTNKDTALTNLHGVNYNAAQTLTTAQKQQARQNVAAPMRNYLAGLILSTAGSTAVFGVSLGECADSTNVDLIEFPANYAKTTTTWAAGSSSSTGSLDTGTIAINSWYHVFIIKNVTSGAVDVLISLSATAPTMPSGFTLFRRIGAMVTNGSSQWSTFTQIGDTFLWAAAVGNIASLAVTTTSQLVPLTVPPGINVKAMLNAVGVAGGTSQQILLSSGASAVQVANTPSGNYNINCAASAVAAGQFLIDTDTSQNIRVVGTGAITLFGTTQGWIDSRGKSL